MDTSRAIEIGKFLTANYIVTGSLIEMSGSVVIFGRIINVETGEIESVAQVSTEGQGCQETADLDPAPQGAWRLRPRRGVRVGAAQQAAPPVNSAGI